MHAETGQPPIDRFEAGGPPRQADPALTARGVPLVGDPQGDPHRDRAAGRQRLRRGSGADRPPGRAALRPRGPDPPRRVPGRQARRPGGAVRHPPARAPRRPAGRPPDPAPTGIDYLGLVAAAHDEEAGTGAKIDFARLGHAPGGQEER